MDAKQQMMMTLKIYLGTFHVLTEDFLNDLDSKIVLNVFEKGDYLLKEGSVCEQMHFIVKGCVQCYLGSKQRRETLWFMAEGEIALFKNSFYDQEKSLGSIVTLEDTEVLSIAHADLERLYEDHPFLERIGRKITEYYHKRSDIKSYVLYPKKPQERLDRYRKYCPQMVERVPQKQLASFLGMREETLSRLLHEKKKDKVD